MRELYIIFLLSLLLFTQVQAQTKQERNRITGKVTDSITGEEIKRVSFKVLPYNRDVKTDQNGKFILNIPKGSSITLVFDYFPFDQKEVYIETQNDTVISISLTSTTGSKYLEEVEVIASKPVNDKLASVERLDKQLFLTLPALMGERDVVKTLALTSGVSSSGEGSADMQVRGGTHGQNLYLMNDVPLYFTQHALGLTSAYNPAIIGSGDFYKAAFPAKYGGKVSSILAINTIAPSLTKWSGEFEMGLISSKGMINIPLKKDKIGLFLSGRVSNFTPLLGAFNILASKDNTKIGIYFSDWNAGLKYRISESDELNVDFFRVSDSWDMSQKDFDDLTSVKKQNSQINLSLNWKRKLSENSENKFTFYADHFFHGQTNGVETAIIDQTKRYTSYGFNSAISTVKVSDIFSLQLNEKVHLSLGGSYQDNIIHPLQFNSAEELNQKSNSISLIHLHEGSLFSEAIISLTEKQRLNLGLRATAVGSKEVFSSLEPRASYLLQLPQNYSLSASISRMTQPIHRVANSGLGIPTEIFVPSFQLMPPEKSWVASFGVGKEMFNTNNRITMKADAWYKELAEIIEFKDGMDALTMLTKGHNVYSKNQQVLTTGNGKAFGLDFSVFFHQKKMTVIADYTLMKAVNQFDELNEGKTFAAPTDIRNSLSLTWSYKFKHNILFSANWLFNSGRPITVPTRILPNANFNLSENNIDFEHFNTPFIFQYTERNNYRTKAFHKLDVSITKNFLIKKKHQSSFSLGLYNAYNQSNPFLYSLAVKSDGKGNYRPVLNSVSVFPVLPSFNWRVKF